VPRAELDLLPAASGILVLGGTEVTIEEGDVLVVGLRRVDDDVVNLAAPRDQARKDHAFIVAALRAGACSGERFTPP
jgi:hypothetical protein